MTLCFSNLDVKVWAIVSQLPCKGSLKTMALREFMSLHPSWHKGGIEIPLDV